MDYLEKQTVLITTVFLVGSGSSTVLMNVINNYDFRWRKFLIFPFPETISDFVLLCRHGGSWQSGQITHVSSQCVGLLCASKEPIQALALETKA